MPNITETVNYYFERDLNLIRLIEKKALDVGWNKNPTPEKVIRAHIERGGNVGWHIGPRHIVVDVDPRHDGHKTIQKLCDSLNLSLQALVKSTVSVITGGGGLHLYFKNPAGLTPKAKNKDYPGLDILSGSRYVLIPGCVHPDSKRVYGWHPDSPTTTAALPPQLHDFLQQKWGALQSVEDQGHAKEHLFGLLPVDDLPAVLAAIDPSEHRDDWVSYVLGVWHMVGGDVAAIEHVIEWSLRDPEYAGDDTVERRVGQIWYSARPDYDNPKTIRSFASELLEAQPDTAAKLRSLEASRVFEDSLEAEKSLMERAQALTPEIWANNRKVVRDLLKDILASDDQVATGALKKAIKEKTQATHEDLTTMLRALALESSPKNKRSTTDWVLILAQEVLNTDYDGGRHIIRAGNEQFYVYSDGIWKTEPTEAVHHRGYLRAHRARMTEGMKADPHVIAKGIETDIRMSRYKEEFLNNKNLPSAINCANGTVWIDQITGGVDFRDHNPPDYFAYKIPLVYDPTATCPSFDIMLEQVFGWMVFELGREAYDDFIRHWWEVVGYMVQPNKNRPLVVIWHGAGQNGKTTFSNIITSLIGGDAVFSTRINQFTKTNDNHSTTSLEGRLILLDDDVQANVVLAEDMLKAYSENKRIEVNPKNKPKYSTMVHLTPLLLTNNDVIVRDRSHGMWRRLDVTHFRYSLEHLKNSPLPQRVRDRELPGVLNQALAGLARMRARGDFDFPEWTLRNRDAFFENCNPVCKFVTRRYKPNPMSSLSAEDMYECYKQTAGAHKEKIIECYSRFTAIVSQMGYRVENEVVHGLE